VEIAPHNRSTHRSGELRVAPPAAHGTAGAGERQRRREPNRVDCVRIVHKTANVLNVLPKSVPRKAKADLHAIYGAENRSDAEEAFDRFLAKYQAKYDKAARCLAKDREALLAFYGVPAEHGKHVRSTNPVESTFATVRLRTATTKGCLSRATALAMVFKLARSAERHRRRLNGPDRLAAVIRGVRFRDGEPAQDTEDQAAA
jgi:putative transposase